MKENVLAAGQWNESAGKVKKSINVPLNKIGEMAPRAGFTLHQVCFIIYNILELEDECDHINVDISYSL